MKPYVTSIMFDSSAMGMALLRACNFSNIINFGHRSYIPMEFAPNCEFIGEFSNYSKGQCGERFREQYMAEGYFGSHAVVRERGHYFGTCLFFNPPGLAPIGMDNKV